MDVSKVLSTSVVTGTVAVVWGHLRSPSLHVEEAVVTPTARYSPNLLPECRLSVSLVRRAGERL